MIALILLLLLFYTGPFVVLWSSGKKGFFLRLLLSVAASLALGFGLVAVIDASPAQVPRWAVVGVAIVPTLYFLWHAVSKHLITHPGRLLLSGLIFPGTLFAAAIVWVMGPPNLECGGILGRGSFDGKSVVAVGPCETWFHEYEEYIEIYPERWNWVGDKQGRKRLGSVSGSVEGDDGTVRFSMPPVRVEFDGSRLITVFFADGSKEQYSVRSY
jgi:hypothetical protein